MHDAAKIFINNIESELKWRSIKEIEVIPFDSFEELVTEAGANKVHLGIDYGVANKFAEFYFGKFHTWIFLMVAAGWIWTSISSVVLAIYLSNYWLLLGIPISFIGFVFSNPFNPARRLFKLIAIALFFVVIGGLFSDFTTLHFLSLFYLLSFSANSYVYEVNQSSLKREVLKSEILFIYLFQTRAIGLKFAGSEQPIWADKN